MLKNLKFKNEADPDVTQYNILALNMNIRTYSPEPNLILKIDDIQSRRIQFLGDNYRSENPYKIGGGEYNPGKNYQSLHYYNEEEKEQDFQEKDMGVYNAESSFIDLKQQEEAERGNFCQEIPMDFQKCQDLGRIISENEFKVFSDCEENQPKMRDMFDESGFQLGRGESFEGKENTNWKPVDNLVLNYRSLDFRDCDYLKQGSLTKSRYIPEVEKDNFQTLHLYPQSSIEEVEASFIHLPMTKKNSLEEKVEPSQVFSRKLKISNCVEKENQGSKSMLPEQESTFREPNPSPLVQIGSGTQYESFSNDVTIDLNLRSPTRRIHEWTPNPHSPYETCTANGLGDSDFNVMDFTLRNLGSKYIQNPSLFEPVNKTIRFKDFLKRILKKNKGYVNYELELALRKFVDSPLFKQRIVNFLDKKHINNTTIYQKRMNWRDDETRIMQNFYSKNKIEAFTEVKDFKDKDKNDRYLGVISGNVEDRSSVYSLMEKRGKKVILTVKKLPEEIKMLRTRAVKKRHIYRSPSKIASERKIQSSNSLEESEIPCMMFLNKQKQFLHVFDLLKRRTLNVFTVKDKDGELAEVVDYDNSGEEVYVLTNKNIIVFSIFDLSIKCKLDLIDEAISIFYIGYQRVMLIPRFGNLIEIFNLELGNRKFIVFEKECLKNDRGVLQGGKRYILVILFKI